MTGVTDEKAPFRSPKGFVELAPKLRGTSWEHSVCMKQENAYMPDFLFRS